MNTTVGLLKGFVNLLYPRACASCAKPLESVNDRGACDACLAKIRPNPEPYCRSCGRSRQAAEDPCPECRKMRPYFSSAHSACLYEGPLKELIHKFKYNNRRTLSGAFTAIMLDFIKDNQGIMEGVEIITFVPLHKKRAGMRGYNQSELLASRIGKELGIPVAECLEKTRSTKNQNELSRDERLINVRGAFRVKPNYVSVLCRRHMMVGHFREMSRPIKGRDILIIDDVMTTGATLNETSRLLMDSGAGRVRCLTLARGI